MLHAFLIRLLGFEFEKFNPFKGQEAIANAWFFFQLLSNLDQF